MTYDVVLMLYKMIYTLSFLQKNIEENIIVIKHIISVKKNINPLQNKYVFVPSFDFMYFINAGSIVISDVMITQGTNMSK